MPVFLRSQDEKFNPLRPEKVKMSPKVTRLFGTFGKEVFTALRKTRISDITRVHLLHRSMAISLAYTASKELEPYTPRGFSQFDRNQLFYLAVCFSQCHAHGNHGLPRLLCNTVLPNIIGFTSAFKCKPGDILFTDTPWSL